MKKRGSPPLGGGEVQFLCPVIKQVKTLNFVDPGKIKRIRGISSVPSSHRTPTTTLNPVTGTRSALALNSLIE
jgi:RNA 3'-terminal phosphate cyclase